MKTGRGLVEATRPTAWSGGAPEGDNGALKDRPTVDQRKRKENRKEEERKVLKTNRSSKALTFALLLLASVILATMITPAAAAVTISISPTQGPPHTKPDVTLSGLPVGVNQDVYFDQDADGLVDWPGDYQLASNKGNETFTVQIPGNATAGAHDIMTIATGTTGNNLTPSASTTFTVTIASITLSPSSGYVGDLITITGSGFTPGRGYTIQFNKTTVTTDWVTVASFAALTDGSMPLRQFTVMDATAGAHVVAVNETATGKCILTRTFTVLTKIVLSPSAGPPGLGVRVIGTAFNATADVTIYFDKNKNGARNVDENVTAVAITTDGYGSFNQAGAFLVPTVAYDTYTVWANDTTGVEASAPFTVSPASITLSPTSGIVGAYVRMDGLGFTPTATISATFDTTGVTWIPGGPTVELDGTFTGTFEVPVGPSGPGTYSVNATDGSVWATAPFTIPTPSITLNVTSGPPLGDVRLTGVNFGNGTEGYSASLRIENSTSPWNMTITPISITVTSAGDVDANFTIPCAADYPYPGDYLIRANLTSSPTDYGHIFNATTPFTVPTPSVSLSPTSGVIGSTVTVSGTDCVVSKTVEFHIDATALPGTATVGPDGSFTFTFTVPTGLLSGPHTVNATVLDTLPPPFRTFLMSFTVTTAELIPIEEKLDWVLGNLTSITSDLSAINTAIADIEAKLDEGGDFYMFVNSWFTVISNKLGTFTGTDTVASLLYEIEVKLDLIEEKVILAPSAVKFDFGTETSLCCPEFIRVSPTTAYSPDPGYGWTDTSDLRSRDRGAPPEYTMCDLIFSSEDRTFKVDLPNGNYTVIVTIGDQSYTHDMIEIYAEGDLKATVDLVSAGTFAQRVFIVSVTDGSLDLTLKDAGGVDANWVINALIIQRSWSR